MARLTRTSDWSVGLMPWKDRNKRNEKCRAYHAKHLDAMRARSRRYHAKNKTQIIARKREQQSIAYFQRLANRYGVSVDYLLEMRARQNNACALCDRSGEVARLVLDHDHETGRVRGWLCMPCNTGLGRLGDNSAGLMRALLYLSQDRHAAQNQPTGVLA